MFAIIIVLENSKSSHNDVELEFIAREIIMGGWMIFEEWNEWKLEINMELDLQKKLHFPETDFENQNFKWNLKIDLIYCSIENSAKQSYFSHENNA